MEEVLPQLLAFPPHSFSSESLSDADYDHQIRLLLQVLSQTTTTRLIAQRSNASQLFEVLHATRNTIPYLHTLLAHIGPLKGLAPSNPLWQQMMELVHNFDPVQIRYTGLEFRRLLEAVIHGAEKAGNPIAALAPVRIAMLRLDPSGSCFTSTHVLFVRACLQARAYSSALPILDNNIYHFPSKSERHLALPCAQHETSSTFITEASNLSEKLYYRDHLMYFLYGAMIYMALHDWERASSFLEIAIISPSTHGVVSMIQVETYKKWVLVGLIRHGKLLAMPTHTNAAAAKLYRAMAKPYEVMAVAFKESAARFDAEIEAAQHIWQNDSNVGLVKQARLAYRRFTLVSLSHIYRALSLPEVASRISSDAQPASIKETETFITSLISEGHLNATLYPSKQSKPPVLHFAASAREGPLARSEDQLYSDLLSGKARIEALNHHMKGAERKLQLTKEYLDHLRRQRRAGANGSGGEMKGGSQMPGHGVIDDDMMAEM